MSPSRPEASQSPTPFEHEEFCIRGLTRAGAVFRPGDWAERLCRVMGSYGSTADAVYSPHVFPVRAAGVKCVVVRKRLQQIAPMAYEFLVNFARDNELQTTGLEEDPRSGFSS